MRHLHPMVVLIIGGISVLFYSCSNPQGTAIGEDESVQESIAEGEVLYQDYCLSCHQADGSGVPGLYPPVIETDWVSGDKKRLIHLTLYGLSGPIEVNGEPYSGEMAAHDFLSDQEIADLLTYLRRSFGNTGDPVSPAEVAEVRE